MTKEEILEKSRNENGDRDMYDLEVQNMASKIAFYCIPLFCLVVCAVQYDFTKKISAGVWSVFFGALFVAFLVKFVKMRKLHEFFVCISYFVIFVLLLVLHVFQLMGRV